MREEGQGLPTTIPWVSMGVTYPAPSSTQVLGAMMRHAGFTDQVTHSHHSSLFLALSLLLLGVTRLSLGFVTRCRMR
jgi:hypothetical protein